MSAARIAIAFDRVVKRYGGRAVLDGVSLDVPAGTFLAIVGASGSGKTTLLRLINRLIEPDAGVVRVDGKDVLAVDAPALRRRIGYVFQGTGLFPHMSVAQNVAITPRLLAWDADAMRQRADELLRLVRLEPEKYRNRMPRELSGGEAQRVGLARALAAKPTVLLMDEPFGALDPLTRAALGDDVRQLHEAMALTTVMITHDMTEALLLADRIAVIRDGRIVADDTPERLVAATNEPYVAELMTAPRRQGERLRALTGRTA